VGSSNRRAAHDLGFEEKENLAIHRQEGHQAPLANIMFPQQQPSFFKPRAFELNKLDELRIVNLNLKMRRKE